MEAVIGIRDAGKTKKPPDANSLHSEPMGDGLRLGFRKPSMMLFFVHTLGHLAWRCFLFSAKPEICTVNSVSSTGVGVRRGKDGEKEL